MTASLETLHIAKQIAEALETAHDKNITHRDLKPANVRIIPEGTVKVLISAWRSWWSRPRRPAIRQTHPR